MAFIRLAVCELKIVTVLYLGLLLISASVDACGQAGDGENPVVAEEDVLWVAADGSLEENHQTTEEKIFVRQLNRLGNAYYDLNTEESFAQAFFSYQKAAEKAYVPAQNNLGNLYQKGLGTELDLKLAFKWFYLAAEQGNAMAQHSLASMYLSGKGVDQDISTGMKWLERSAKHNHLSAIRDLATLLWQGKAVSKNKILAYKWMLLGAMKGDADSEFLLASAKLSMNNPERIQAQQRFEEEFIPKGKRTLSGLYLDAYGAYKKWEENPGAIKLIDVRTPAEYSLIGHSPMAYNIPVKNIVSFPTRSNTKLTMAKNPDFIAEVEKRFKTQDTLVIICRSGYRSARAADLLVKAGYQTVYSIVDGFEGDKIKRSDSKDKGHRLKNGWRQSGAPWTYSLKAGLVYDSRLRSLSRR